MSIEDFQANLTTYGPNLADWPDPEREAARVLLSKSEYARQIHDVALLLKKQLGGKQVTAPKDLVDRIVDKAIGPKSGKPTS